MATSNLEVGTIVPGDPKDSVYKATERFYMAKGRSMVAAKGGSRQRKYPCDQVKQGCKAVVKWVKQADGSWKCSSIVAEHVNCGGAATTASGRGGSDVIKGIIENDTSISGPKLTKAVEAATGGKFDLRTVQRVKQKLAEVGVAEQVELMTKVRPYLRELEKHSPGTVTNVEADQDGHMTRCFVMLGKTVEVVAKTGLKVASMDAAFIKTEHKGQLITLGARDDNNTLLPIAFAIVDKESTESYSYFLEHCMESPTFAATFNNPDMTCFIDGHKGSPAAIRKWTNLMQIFRCLQHYLKNAPAIGSALVNNAYNAARAPTKAQFDSFMRRIKLLKPATFDHMIRVLPLSSWTHHACDQTTRIGDTVTSNNAESLINQVGEATRRLEPLKMLEALVDQAAATCAKRAKLGVNSSEIFTPHAVKSFETERGLSRGLFVKDYGDDTYKVENGGLHPGSNTVDLEFRSPGDGGHVMECTCGFCVRHGIPCRHALAVAKHLGKMDVARELIDDGYKVHKYRAAYGNASFRIRPPALETLESDPTLLPPKTVEDPAGRPKGKRKRKRVASTGEANTSSKFNVRQSASPGGAGAADPSLSQQSLSQQS